MDQPGDLARSEALDARSLACERQQCDRQAMRAFRFVMISLWPVIATLTAASTPSFAQEAGASLGDNAPPEAQRHFRDGIESWRTNQFEDAARSFEAGLKAWPSSAKLAKFAARAWDKTNGAAAAVKAYQLYLELAPFPEDQEEVDAAIARLQPIAEQQRTVVVIASRPAGARVFLDARKDQALGQTPLEVKLDPGSYVILTALKGREADRRTIIVQHGQPVKLDIELTIPGADAEIGGGFDWRMPAGYGLMGLGAASVALGVYFGSQAKDTQSRIEALPPGDRDDYDRLESEFDGQHLGATLGLAGGGVLIAGGAALIVWRLVAPKSAPEPAASPTDAGPGTGLLWTF